MSTLEQQTTEVLVTCFRASHFVDESRSLTKSHIKLFYSIKVRFDEFAGEGNYPDKLSVAQFPPQAHYYKQIVRVKAAVDDYPRFQSRKILEKMNVLQTSVRQGRDLRQGTGNKISSLDA